MKFAFATAWPGRQPRLGIAFTESFLLAIRLGSSGRASEDGARTRTRSIRLELPEGMVTPGPVAPNIESVREVARMASEMVDALSGRRGTLALALPDLSVVTALHSASAAGPGVDEADRAAKLVSRLGFPVSEARMDFWRGRKGELLGAAVRVAVVRQYEQIAEAVDCRLSWVDGASLVRIPLWAEASATEPNLCVRVQLYRSHYHVAVFHAGELVDIRTRLRTDEDVDDVAEEIFRLPALWGVASLGGVVLTGEGAGSCALRLGEEGSRLGRVVAAEEGEEVQLSMTLEALMRRDGLFLSS